MSINVQDQRTSTVAMKITRVSCPSGTLIGKPIAGGDNGAQKALEIKVPQAESALVHVNGDVYPHILPRSVRTLCDDRASARRANSSLVAPGVIAKPMKIGKSFLLAYCEFLDWH
jgi:hypothetical protein